MVRADPSRHQPELAAALCAHARYGGGWQVSGGLAELGGDTLREAHEKITTRAAEILEKATAGRPRP